MPTMNQKWEKPGDPLYRSAGMHVEPMFQIMDQTRTFGMQWVGKGKPGPWPWLQPGQKPKKK